MARSKHMRDVNGNLTVDQGTENGWVLSWNPDDNRFYVEHPDEPGVGVATFRDRHNATQYARRSAPHKAYRTPKQTPWT